MPVVEIKDFEDEFSDDERADVSAAVTDAMVRFTGERIRPHTGVVVERDHLPAPRPGAPGVFNMASGERMGEQVADAGLTAVRTAAVPVRLSYSDLDGYETWVREVTSFSTAVDASPERERRTLTAALEATFEPFRASGGYELPAVALTAAAVKPTAEQAP